MRDLGLPQRLAAKGLTVELYPGWETRGSDIYTPVGALNHNTAGPEGGRAPSLGTVAYGRPDVDGPLSQVLQTREAYDAWDHVIVVASGRANHGGVGSWKGLSGNRYFGGNEIEHTGTGAVSIRRLEVSARVAAAFLEAPGASRNSDWAAQHAEYAEPAGRKIDFFSLWPWTWTTWRARVGYWIGRTATGLWVPGGEPLPPPPDEEDDMAKVEKHTIVNPGAVSTYYYVMPDGTIVDRDHLGTTITAAEAKNFDAVLFNEQALQTQVDMVQAAVNRATRERYGTS